MKLAKHKLFQNFNILLFIVLGIIDCTICFLSFIAAWAEDDGSLTDNLFAIILAKSFYILRFPIHTFFSASLNNIYFFYYALFINAIIRSIFFERSYYFYKQFRK